MYLPVGQVRVFDVLCGVFNEHWIPVTGHRIESQF